MHIEKSLKYSKTHEWVRVSGNIAYIGISDYAQGELGDIVYVELPEVNTEIEKDEEACTIESVKAASPINSPVSGKIIEVNSELEDKPELLNQKPYEAFIFAVEMNDSSELNHLMDAETYEKFCEEQKKKH
ncbi:MAG: glycine cleavage system protein GcvH [Spirochaetes bacterium]|nr:glycine cleavage system protein GcvH [Spirochaetota bacterium]